MRNIKSLIFSCLLLAIISSNNYAKDLYTPIAILKPDLKTIEFGEINGYKFKKLKIIDIGMKINTVSLSPDAKFLAIIFFDNVGHRNLGIYDINKQEFKKLSLPFNEMFEASWSPTGEMIALNVMAKEWRAAVYNISDSRLTVGTEECWNPRWITVNNYACLDLKGQFYIFDQFNQQITKIDLTKIKSEAYFGSGSNTVSPSCESSKFILNTETGSKKYDEFEKHLDGVPANLFVFDFKSLRITPLIDQVYDGMNAHQVDSKNVIFRGQLLTNMAELKEENYFNNSTLLVFDGKKIHKTNVNGGFSFSVPEKILCDNKN